MTQAMQRRATNRRVPVAHGTESSYRRGCRCTPCSSVWREDPDMLTAACWCGSDYLRVPSPEIHKGRTRSCGRPGCQPRQGAA
jgi:hypothetical protein